MVTVRDRSAALDAVRVDADFGFLPLDARSAFRDAERRVASGCAYTLLRADDVERVRMRRRPVISPLRGLSPRGGFL